MENNNIKATGAPLISATIHYNNPETGEAYVKTIEGEGIAFGVLVSDDGEHSEVKVGVFGRFSTISLASTLDSIEEGVYEERPRIKELRLKKKAHDALTELAKKLAEDDEGEDDRAEV